MTSSNLVDRPLVCIYQTTRCRIKEKKLLLLSALCVSCFTGIQFYCILFLEISLKVLLDQIKSVRWLLTTVACL
jgi:hypothetical protein